MSYLDIVDRVLKEQAKKARQEAGGKVETPPNLADISLMRLSEFSKRNMAIEIYSEVLGSTIWLCPNEGMVAQIRKDDPRAICYTVDELRALIRLKPDPESLRRIHAAKSVFPGSRLVDSKLKEELSEGLKPESCNVQSPEQN